MDFFPTAGSPVSFAANAVLVVASSSFANAGQLAADLLITSLHLRKAGLLLTASLTPCVGNDALGSTPCGVLSTSLELYASQDGRFAVLQQRSPAARGRTRTFARELSSWAKQAGFACVVQLCALEPCLEPNAALHTPFRIATAAGVLRSPLDAPAAWGAPLQARELTSGGCVPPPVFSPPWPLLEACAGEKFPSLALCVFCAEGDNRREAALLAARCCELLGVTAPEEGWTAPASWSFVFGESPE